MSDVLPLIWIEVLMLPTIIAALRGRRLRWFALANLAAGWNPIWWIVLLGLAARRAAPGSPTG